MKINMLPIIVFGLFANLTLVSGECDCDCENMTMIDFDWNNVAIIVLILLLKQAAAKRQIGVIFHLFFA
jgi:hypothetical protein